MTNAQMVENRFLKLHKGRTLFNKIQATLSDPKGVVLISTCTKAIKYTSKHAGFFTINAKGEVYVASGKNKLYAGWSNFAFGRIA